jgi:hypothetical protein
LDIRKVTFSNFKIGHLKIFNYIRGSRGPTSATRRQVTACPGQRASMCVWRRCGGSATTRQLAPTLSADQCPRALVILILTQLNAKQSTPSLLAFQHETFLALLLYHALPLLGQSPCSASHRSSLTSLRVKTPRASTLGYSRPSSGKVSPLIRQPPQGQSS